MKLKEAVKALLILSFLWLVAMLLVRGILVANPESERELAFYVMTFFIGFGFYVAYYIGKEKNPLE
ncbi:MAG: hypothetical protein UU67_C0090G0003 [Candidatus Daviesbacteria bacterium GW2011_GWB1_41_5]|uniref:Uncharacterized protein n=1 Tax=Candidatus Daviesbacteria bacterium GW2011_GWB1_41_5 TaxID=1618429 RepID=A0A0G0ZD41_9BACT|nr:MAG: hypothetical protein UU67_C0090G0003 [Candidatus Daviesbacteria bacterium GW2011_GWB1_41_5]